MTALQQLRRLRALLEPDGAWLPISFGAVDAGGHSCPARSTEAVRWGMLAGLVRIEGPFEERLKAVDLLCRVVSTRWLYEWEQAPGRSQAEVLATIDAAAELALEEEWR